VSLNETLVLTLVNQDTIEHYFSWHDQSANIWVNPGQAVTLSRTFNSFGSYALLATDFMGQRLGASCTVLVGQANYKRFVWNLWENNANESLQIAAQNQTTIPSQYRPDVFTINGLDYPLNMNDTLGMVQGLVHDSIYITVLNAGNMLHPIHFHGYHVQVVQSYLAPNKVNWKKDSFPVQQKDVVVFLLIPDKPGQYPVHDHNLTANTSAGGYPGGMMTMIEISQ
jgi:FtsP/CotA-like multicopper oxidase with cupredoxin domain